MNRVIDEDKYTVSEDFEYTDSDKEYANFSELFYDKLNTAFNDNDISKEEVSNILGLKPSYLTKIVNKSKNTTRDCIIAICIILGLDNDMSNYALSLYGLSRLCDERSFGRSLIVRPKDK